MKKESTAEERVRAKHPMAYATYSRLGWIVKRSNRIDAKIQGIGSTEASAWKDASANLK